MIFPWRNGKVGDAFDADFIPHGRQIMTLIDLNLICDRSSAEGFIISVLQIPPGLRLLHIARERLLFDAFGSRLVVEDQPNLQVLDRVTILILGRSLPCNDVGSQGGESELKDVFGGEGGNDCTIVCADDVDAAVATLENGHVKYGH